MSNRLSLDELHLRYQHQATWTAQIRSRLYRAAKLDAASRILEVGSGTGAITSELARRSSARIFGIDIDHRLNAFARSQDGTPSYLTGDGFRLPFADSTFDATICHYLLLWIDAPERLLREMLRITAQNGAVLALAEPDYGGRIDYPDELIQLGTLQAQALAEEGADTRIGRKLRALFSRLGLWNLQVGLLGGEWSGELENGALASEWAALEADLSETVSKGSLREYRRADLAAWEDGTRILYVPTFYAIGFVPPES